MTKQWRPKDWKNPYIGKLNTPHAMALERDAFEAGADALLTSLFKHGLRVNNISPEHTGKGIVVFIPGEEK